MGVAIDIGVHDAGARALLQPVETALEAGGVEAAIVAVGRGGGLQAVRQAGQILRIDRDRLDATAAARSAWWRTTV